VLLAFLICALFLIVSVVVMCLIAFYHQEHLLLLSKKLDAASYRLLKDWNNMGRKAQLYCCKDGHLSIALNTGNFPRSLRCVRGGLDGKECGHKAKRYTHND
jgi:hypothetical protein